MRRLEADLGAAKRELRAAMAEAHSKDKETIAAMAAVLGVTRQRAAQMLKEASP